MRVVAFYLRIFFGTGVPFGLFVGLSYWDGPRGLREGVEFGLLMAVLLGSWLLWRSRREPAALEPRQESTVLVPAGADVVRERALGVLRTMAPAGSVDEGRLAARTTRFRGFRISVELRPAGAGTEVTVRSVPTLRWILVDNGASRRNVDQVVAALTPLTTPAPRPDRGTAPS